MLRSTYPQRSIFRVEFVLDPEKSHRLEDICAKPLLDQVLPFIMENEFAEMYCRNYVAPNNSVRTLIVLYLYFCFT